MYNKNLIIFLLYGGVALWRNPNTSICIGINLIFQEFTPCLWNKAYQCWVADGVSFKAARNQLYIAKRVTMYLHRHGNKYRLSCHGVPCSLPLLDWRENESQNQQCDYCTRHSLHNNPEKMQNTKQLNIAVIWEMIAFTIVLQFRHNGSIYFIYFLS